MKKFIYVCLSALIITTSLSGCAKSVKMQKFTEYSFDYFDTVTTIIGYENNHSQFDCTVKEIKAKLSEYHNLYDIYSPAAENNIYIINRTENGTHTNVRVDNRIIDLLEFSKDMYNKTDGKLNIAFGSVLSIWHKYRNNGINNPESAQLPPSDSLISASQHTDINKLEIDRNNSTVFISDPQLTLDVGAIAKGYAVEEVAKFLKNKGKSGYLLNVGGNIRAIGKKPDGDEWTVGIENPDNTDEHIEYLKIDDMAVVTSGRYQRYYTVDGKNYNHIIDTNNLMPGEKYKSVSVISDNSGLADALSTSLFLMDYAEGINLLKKFPNTAAMWVFDDGRIEYTDNFAHYRTQIIN